MARQQKRSARRGLEVVTMGWIVAKDVQENGKTLAQRWQCTE